jgi:O-antigen/teichoic acid export membrane protein
MFARSASGTFGLRVFDAGVTVVVTLILARALGASGFGIFSYALAWAALLGVPAMLGLEQLIVRGVARAEAARDAAGTRGLIDWSIRTAILASVASAALAGVGITLLGAIPAGGEIAFWVAMLLIPVTALVRVVQAALRGLEHVLAGFVPELAAMPVMTLTFVAAGVVVLGQAFDPVAAMAAHILAAVIALAVAGWLLIDRLPSAVRRAVPALRHREWLAAAMPLLFISGAHVINRQTDVVMLGVLDGAEAAGIYAVAARGVQLITFVTYAVAAPLAPRVAALHTSGDIQGLRRVVTSSARVMLVFSLPAVALFLILGPWLLGFFGAEFTAGAPALAVLALGQLASAAAGPAGLTLLMTGHERAAAVGAAIGAVVNVLLNLLLIPAFGLLGAAAATAIATTLWSLIHVLMVRRRLDIDSTALGRGHGPD